MSSRGFKPILNKKLSQVPSSVLFLQPSCTLILSSENARKKVRKINLYSNHPNVDSL